MLSLEGTMVLAACADNEFADAAGHVGFAVGSLRSEAFVIVIVAADNDVRVCVVERLPDRFECEIIAVGAAGTEKRLVKIGKGAGDGMRSKVGAEPLFLARASVAAADFGALAIENDDGPRSRIVDVITVVWIGGGGAEVLEVVRCASLMKFVVAGGRACAVFHAAPSFVVALKILFAPVGIGKVAGGEDSAGDFLEELGGCFRAGEILAVRNIACADEDGCGVRDGVFHAARGGARKNQRAEDRGECKCQKKQQA